MERVYIWNRYRTGIKRYRTLYSLYSTGTGTRFGHSTLVVSRRSPLAPHSADHSFQHVIRRFSWAQASTYISVRGALPRQYQNLYRSPRMSRPEHSAPPEVFYNESEARKYTTNTRMVNIQASFLFRRSPLARSCVALALTRTERQTERHPADLL